MLTQKMKGCLFFFILHETKVHFCIFCAQPYENIGIRKQNLKSGKHTALDGDELHKFASSEAFGPSMNILVLLWNLLTWNQFILGHISIHTWLPKGCESRAKPLRPSAFLSQVITSEPCGKLPFRYLGHIKIP